jgi:hypothetical protein
MGAATYQLESSHVAMLSQPERVIDVICTAAVTSSELKLNFQVDDRRTKPFLGTAIHMQL